MRKKRRIIGKVLRSLVGVTVSVLLLGWILYKADVYKVVDAVKELSPWCILATVLIAYISIPLRVLQWRFLLGNPPGVSPTTVFRALCMGYVGNGLLPLGGGEFLKAYVLARLGRLPLARTLVSVILIRLQDLFAILLLTTVVLGALPLSDYMQSELQAMLPAGASISHNMLHAALRATSLLCLAAVLSIIVSFLYRDIARRVVVSLLKLVSSRFAAWCDHRIRQLNEGMNALGDTRCFLYGEGCAFLCWAVFVVAPLPILLGFSMSFHQACVSTLAINGLATLAQLFPIAPAALGTYHAVCVFALLAFNPGMHRETAVAYAFVSHLVATVSPVLPGLVFLPGSWEQFRAARHTRRHENVATEDKE